VLLQLLTIARNTFVESIRQPIFFVLVMICGVLQLLNTWGTGFAMGYTESGEVSGDNKLLFDVGLATVFVCGTLLAAFVATAVVSREIENKTVLTVVSKPVGRPSLIVGKYLGVAGSMIIAIVPMLIFLLMGLRHGVMSTASDDLDMPVITFTFIALAVAMLTAAWCNFFYGWYFSQTCMLLLAPGMVVAYLGVLLINKTWHFQHIQDDFKPQITFASYALTLALLVLTAVATAVSTRLGQVMTIVVCAGVFVFGLLTNYFIGRHVFENQPLAVVQSAVPESSVRPGWSEPGSTYTITFQTPPKLPIRPGDRFFYGPSPNGFPMSVPSSRPFKGDPANDVDLLGPRTAPGLVVVSSDVKSVRVRRSGQDPYSYTRTPEPNDYVFLSPTSVRIAPLVLWGIIPNMQYFWLVDAVSQNNPVPPFHLVLLTAYAACQIAGFLSIGVILFQRRDVG
jgi:ABC-type transport system involved in multi-copper enzyme maturation permease subunit